MNMLCRRPELAAALLVFAADAAALAPPQMSLGKQIAPVPPPHPVTRRSLAGLAAFGSTAGPLVDSVHNQCLLKYDVLPIEIPCGIWNAQTSLLIPPLLALTYALLGAVLPAACEFVVGSGRTLEPPAGSLSPRARAALAVASTIGIIKLSELLTLSALPALGSLALLLACCLLQWAVLDGALASLLLAIVVAIGGPLAEIPFMQLGCWHYISPDYFPLASWLGDGIGGLSSLTGPCYFAVTTDAIALGRWLGSDAQGEDAG